jgi:uncharacterized membrane protein YgcG
VPAGELTPGDRVALEGAIRRAEQLSRCEFSVFVGRSVGDARAFATSLHNSLVAPARSVLVMVDPGAKALEIVTGADVRQRLSDQEVELAAVSMRSDFAAGDMVGGLRKGIEMLAEHARPPRTLHADA